jgi:hypothetical protein
VKSGGPPAFWSAPLGEERFAQLPGLLVELNGVVAKKTAA